MDRDEKIHELACKLCGVEDTGDEWHKVMVLARSIDALVRPGDYQDPDLTVSMGMDLVVEA